MKTIYSLQEFRNAVLEIAKSQNETYTNVGVGVAHDGKITFKAYIPNGSWINGETMESCLQKMKEQFNPPPIKNIDVEIEMPEPVIEVVEPVSADDLPF